jgi:hypothetical protein
MRLPIDDVLHEQGRLDRPIWQRPVELLGSGQLGRSAWQVIEAP